MKLSASDKVIQLLKFIGTANIEQIEDLTYVKENTLNRILPKLVNDGKDGKDGTLIRRNGNRKEGEKNIYILSNRSLQSFGYYKTSQVWDLIKNNYCVNALVDFKKKRAYDLGLKKVINTDSELDIKDEVSKLIQNGLTKKDYESFISMIDKKNEDEKIQDMLIMLGEIQIKNEIGFQPLLSKEFYPNFSGLRPIHPDFKEADVVVDYIDYENKRNIHIFLYLSEDLMFEEKRYKNIIAIASRLKRENENLIIHKPNFDSLYYTSIDLIERI